MTSLSMLRGCLFEGRTYDVHAEQKWQAKARDGMITRRWSLLVSIINEALRLGNVVKFVHQKALKPIKYKVYEFYRDHV
ncbi:cullin-1-like isoform X1 [Iris pallida]|uniref:Cullin-1-like isoform X1 n=1 Tax=Iris pallida TaxID=29817 RepID=A0AAX6FFA3_IRIPA|nr:cullin-1-like isoform X1 [Iris pallida]